LRERFTVAELLAHQFLGVILAFGGRLDLVQEARSLVLKRLIVWPLPEYRSERMASAFDNVGKRECRAVNLVE
jgi:hypothetical protein